MIHATLILEDTIIIAARGDIHNPEDRDFAVDQVHPQGWHVNVADSLTGKMAKGIFTDVEFALLTALAIGLGEEWHERGNSFEKAFVKTAYSVLEPKFKDWPKECRPIP